MLTHHFVHFNANSVKNNWTTFEKYVVFQRDKVASIPLFSLKDMFALTWNDKEKFLRIFNT